MDKINILGLTYQELEGQMLGLNEKKFRAKQLYNWIYKKRVKTFDEMTDISKKFIEVLKEKYVIEYPTVEVCKVSSDGTIKILCKFSDGQLVETVLMRYNYGDSVCVSSQVGCMMGCAFCASGLLKKKRNLTSAEMVGQVLLIDQILKENTSPNNRVSHCVVMGTGEPFDNYDNVLNFVKIINNQQGLEIGARHITISTCGIIPGIERFAKENLQINLAISLHASNDEIRNKLMPINRMYPLKELMEAVTKYNNSSNGRRVTFEYIMLDGLNNSLANAKELVELIKPTFAYVNLIPYNEVKENEFKRASNNSIFRFRDYLNEYGIKATIRKEFGSDIDAACGQLRAKYKKEN